MCKVLVYHTQRNMCFLLNSLLKEHVKEFNEYFNYDRSDFIGLADKLKPDVVFIERRYHIQETASIIHCFKHVHPQSKFIVLARNEEDCHQLKLNMTNNYDAIVDELNIASHIPQIIDNFIRKNVIENKNEINFVDKLTKTEKEIYGYLVLGYKPKQIEKVSNKSYNTVRKHIQNIYTKAEIHNYKGFKN